MQIMSESQEHLLEMQRQTLVHLRESLHEAATEFFRMRLAFDVNDSRRERCKELQFKFDAIAGYGPPANGEGSR